MRYTNKIPAALLAVSAAVCCLSGCGGTTGESSGAASQTSEATSAVTGETPAATTENTSASTTSAATEPVVTEPAETEPAETTPAVTEPVVTEPAETEPAPVTEEPPAVSDEWSPDIAERKEINDSGSLCGIVYLGYIFEEGESGLPCRELFLSSEYAQQFPEICDIPNENCVSAGGGEAYLVIPGKKEYKVTVYRWILNEENEYMGEPGEVLFTSESGAPFLLRCNVSDIMQNSLIEITDEAGEQFSWNPWLSLRDGTVGVDPDKMKVFDFTRYAFAPEPLG